MSDLHDLLAKHRAVAEAATKGRWRTTGSTVEVVHGVHQIVQTSEADVPALCWVKADANHIALNDPELALALNAVAEAAVESGALESHYQRGGGGVCDMCGLSWPCPHQNVYDALTQLHEVMQRKMGDQDARIL